MSEIFEFVYFEGTDTASRPTSQVRSHVRAHPQVFCYKNTSKLNFYFKILVYVKLLLYLCSENVNGGLYKYVFIL